MKVQLTMEFDIPEGYYRCDEEDKDIPEVDLPNHHMGFVKQAIYRSFINFAKCQHLSQALEWFPRNKEISDEHKEWAEIITKAEKTMKIEIPAYIQAEKWKKKFQEDLDAMSDEELIQSFRDIGCEIEIKKEHE